MDDMCSRCARQHDGGPENCITGVVLVCGGRDYADRDRVFRVLDRLAERVEILAIRHGAARGADTLAGEWARARGKVEQRFPADWKTYGVYAGPIRNRAMLEAHDPAVPTSRVCCVVAFPGGSGTANIVRQAEAAGVRVWVISGLPPAGAQATP